MTLQDVLDRLEGVKRNGSGYVARCPAHHDSKPSLSVSIGEGGKILLHCFAGCSTEDVAGAIGLSMTDLFQEPPKPVSKAPRQLAATYKYTDAHGGLIAEKLRYSDKSFSWRKPAPDGWEYNRRGITVPLYNLPAVAAAQTVYLVEGEKDTDTLIKSGRAATTLSDGSKTKWQRDFAETLRGKAVYILPDNDKPGQEYAQMCAGHLKGVATSVKILDLTALWPGLPEKGDISDVAQAMGPEILESLEALAAYSMEWEGEAPATEDNPKKPALIRASAVPYDPPRWTIAPYFQRGKGTLIQGDNGSGKTAFMCAIAAHVTTGAPLLGLPIDTPGDVLMLSVEDDLPVLRGRIEASGGNLDRVSFMTNAAGLTFNSPEVEAAIKEIHAKMVIFDPFQAFLGSKIDMFRSNETRPELAKLFEMCERNDCSCAIIAHMGKSGGDRSAVNRALGSVDIPAAMRSILQLAENPDDENQKVMVHVKCSNAPKGSSIAYTIGDRGGVHWVGFSPMTVEDLSVARKRKEKGVDYEHEPLVQVFNQLITDKPGGGFWSYADLKSEGAKILGFPPFEGVGELRQKLDSGLAREIQKHDGLIITHSVHGAHNARGVRVEQYKVPDGYQTKITQG